MHILVMPSWYPRFPGDISGCFFREQALGLVNTGHQVGVLVSAGRNYKNNLQKIRYFLGGIEENNDHGIRTWRFFSPWVRGYGRLRPCLADKYFRQYCSEYGRPQLIHVQSALPAGNWAVKVKKKYGIPYCVTEHSSAFPRRSLSGKQLQQARKIFTDADLVMAVSSALASSIREQCHVERDIEIVPNFLHHIFEDIGPHSGKKNKHFRFFNVALLTKIKGQDTLVRAFSDQFRGLPVKLYIGGFGEEYDNLKALVSRLGVAGQVKLLGSLTRDEVREQILECDAFVLSSLFETFGVVVIEALACGKPVVATRCGGPEEIVNDFNGVLVSAGSEEELAQGMSTIYNNSHRFDPEKIRQDCLNRFSQKAVIDKLERFYRRIVDYCFHCYSLAATLPCDMKIRNNLGKWILRQVLYKYIPKKSLWTNLRRVSVAGKRMD